MASASKRGTRRWLSHRRLLTVEALLAVGAMEQWAEGLVHDQTWPNWLKVLFSMALVVGFFGGLLVLLERWARAGLSGTHQAVRNLPLPTPMLVIHLAIFIGLYCCYALLAGLPLWS